MRVHVEWIDGREQTYPNVGQVQLITEAQLLTLLGHRVYGGPADHIASIPLSNVRQYRKEE